MLSLSEQYLRIHLIFHLKGLLIGYISNGYYIKKRDRAIDGCIDRDRQSYRWKNRQRQLIIIYRDIDVKIDIMD